MKIIYFIAVHEFLQTLEVKTHTKVVQEIDMLEEFGYMLGMPYSKPISKNLFELRTRGKQEILIFYCFSNNQIYLLHAFIKKTQKTPNREIELAKKRMMTLQ